MRGGSKNLSVLDRALQFETIIAKNKQPQPQPAIQPKPAKPAIYAVANSSTPENKKKFAPNLTGEKTRLSIHKENPAYTTMVDGEHNSGYTELNRTQGNYNTPSSHEVELFKKIVETIIKLLEIDPNAIKEIKEALNKLRSLSAGELLELQEALNKLIDNQPLYAEVNEKSGATEQLYEQVEPQLASPRKPPPELPPPRIKCELRKARDCVQPCKLVTTDSKRFGFLPIKIKTCVEDSVTDPRKNPNTFEQITSEQNISGSGSDPDYEEANNRSKNKK
jgi:hypothetical protein